MKIEDLKKRLPYDEIEQRYSNCYLANERVRGYNEAIDYLASRGYLPSVQRIEGLDEAINEFMETVKDCAGEIHYPHKEVLKAARGYEKLQDGEAITTQKQEWMDIKTAPHGIWVLIFAYGNVCQACWNSNGYWSTFRENRIQPIAATHWMPLPEPPTTEETKCPT